jgi:predicted Na+-dependent transporter
MFSDNDMEEMALVTLPMLLYHPVQLIAGSLISPIFQRWVAQRNDGKAILV